MIWMILGLVAVYLAIGWLVGVTVSYGDKRTLDDDPGMVALAVLAWPLAGLAAIFYGVGQVVDPRKVAKRIKDRTQRKAHALNIMSKDKVADCHCQQCRELANPKVDPLAGMPQWIRTYQQQQGSSTISGPTP